MNQKTYPPELLPQALEWFKVLLRFDTSNPPGNERPLIEFVSKTLAEHGITSTILEAQAGRSNLFAQVIGTDSNLPALLVSAHADVVPVEDRKNWRADPFLAEVINDEIIGRGALDMKYKIAFDLALLIWAKKSGIKRTLKMLLLADEEQGGEFGVKFILEKHRALVQAEYVINEVGGFNLELGGNAFLLLQAGEKGSAKLVLTCTGPALHASTPVANTSITLLSQIAPLLQNEFFAYQLTASTKEFLRLVASALQGPGATVFQALADPLQAKHALELLPDPVLSAQIRAMLCQTLVATKINAGFKHNVIPEQAKAEFDLRLLPGSMPEVVLDQAKNFLTTKFPELEHSWKLELESFEPGYELELTDQMLQKVRQELKQYWLAHPEIAHKVGRAAPGEFTTPFLLPASSDNSSYFRAGIKPLGFAPLFFPKGFPGLALAHGVDERLPVWSFEKGLDCYLQVLGRLLID